MKNIIHIIILSILFSQPEMMDWEIPISIGDYGWYPTNYECVDDEGFSCNAATQWSCTNIGCNWRTTECGGIYGGILDESGTANICHGLSDTIHIGLSDSATAGFRYGEDEINLSPSENVAPFVDGYFYHPDWWGTVDINNVTCDWLQFDSDIRTYPDSINIMEWEIHALILEVPSFVSYKITWPTVTLPEEYDIFLYIYDEDFENFQSYNMRDMNQVTVSQSKIVPTFNGGYHSRTSIRIGQCLEYGPGEYYVDIDGDGLGSGEVHLYCEEYLPDGFVDNNLDVNDEIYCLSNQIDECNLCDGDGTASYYYDFDNDGLGAGEEMILCPYDVTDDMVTNGDDINDDFYCLENFIDECNVCDGSNNDVGCGCFEEGPNTYYYDNDQDGLGSGYPFIFCPSLNEDIQYSNVDHFPELPENYVTNNSDSNDDFYCPSDVSDDCGECDGTNTSCDVFGGGITQFSAIYQSSNNNIRLSWYYLNGMMQALEGIQIVEQIDGNWVTIDSLTNQYLTEYNTSGNETDIGRIVGAIPYDRYFNCYKVQFESDDECLNYLGFETIIEQTTVDVFLNLSDGNNLVSFIGLPEDNSIENILDDQQDNIHFVIGQGIGSFHTDTNDDGILDFWNGNLNFIEPNAGYWINVTEDSTINLRVENCYPTPMNYIYDLEWGNNLISYIGEDNALTTDALPEHIKEVTAFIIGQGVGLFHIDEDNDGTFDTWSGNLGNLVNGSGYWINLDFMPDDSTYHFAWGIEDINKSTANENVRIYDNYITEIPEFEFAQSTQQGFYLIKELDFPANISENGLIITEINQQIIGYRNWNGPYTDVPAMGKDNSEETNFYILTGEKPNFKYYDLDSGKLHYLFSEQIQNWYPNGVNIIEKLYFNVITESLSIPTEIRFNPAFPNPFNPSTQLNFSINNSSNVKLTIYNLNGKIVESLIDNHLSEGDHSINWNAEFEPAGVYFAELLVNQKLISVQKLIYLK